jgi:Cys-tRNA(Pro) deacylase
MHRNVRRVVDAAQLLGVDIEPREFREGTRTAQDAADAIGVELGQIVKTLVFLVDGQAVAALVAGNNMLDEKRLAAADGGASSTRPDAQAVREVTGFPIGGVPPFGHVTPLRVYVDRDLLQYDVVWAAAGTPHVNFAITPEELVKATAGTVCDLRREVG